LTVDSRQLTKQLAVSVAIAVVSCLTPLAAQQRPRAEVTAIVNTSPVQPGRPAELSLKVKLPADIHVQADKPRDPNLIPTVLTLTAPEGVKVESITYPKPVDFKQKSGGAPLLVFVGPEFTINVKVVVAANIGEGDLKLPGRLRYQACNESLCFPPTNTMAEWVLKVQHVE
jgi:DsbC/DsbD-like thiol-disulfide interchange protein